MKTFTNAIVLLSISAANAFGDNLESQEFIGRYHDLVPEAYTACEDKNAGDAAQFVNHCGETVTGICEQLGDRLVFHTDHPEGDSVRIYNFRCLVRGTDL